jgi:hypothetical protein
MVCQGPQEFRIANKDTIAFYQGSRWAKEPKGFLMGLRFAVMPNMAEEPIQRVVLGVSVQKATNHSGDA